MRIRQDAWTREKGWSNVSNGDSTADASLVFVFAGRHQLADGQIIQDVRDRHPDARIVGCSTAGEIRGTSVLDDSVVSTAVAFDHTEIQIATRRITAAADSREIARELAAALEPEDLAHVFLLSKGLDVNGSDLVEGLMNALPKGVTVTGGLSGDGSRFEETLVVSDASLDAEGVVAVGFYGDRIRVGYGSLGGWDSFGPDRKITKSEGNVLYELDNQPALALYKRYLGEHAAGLPATALLFPLSLTMEGESHSVVRTILSVDERQESMTFAGDVPEDARARLMKANFDRQVDGAADAARTSNEALRDCPAELSILISCVGRKLVLQQRVEEEIEAVREVVGSGSVLTGFYSYGEIAPHTLDAKCDLHNQTMTITSFSED
jgi:hypothetical protein